MIKTIVSVVTFLLMVAQAWASTPSLEQIFTEGFYSSEHYESGKCGVNIMNLLERAEQAGVDISRAHILEITNKGFTGFGLVTAEHVRQRGRLNPDYPASGLRYLPGNMNWDFHAVLELDGNIYDYDFGNEPQVVSIPEYFEKMFLSLAPNRTGMVYADRAEKLKDYEVKRLPGKETIAARRERRRYPEGPKFRLENYLAEQANFAKNIQVFDQLAASYCRYLKGHNAPKISL